MLAIPQAGGRVALNRWPKSADGYQVNRFVRPGLIAAGALVVLAAAAACGESTSAGTAPPVYHTGAVPYTRQGVARILIDTDHAAGSARSVHIFGTAPSHDGMIGIDLRVSNRAGGGTLRIKGQKFTIARVGKSAYFTGGAGFWHAFVPSAAVAEQLAGRWLQVPLDQPGFSSFTKLTAKDALFDGLMGSDATLADAGTTTNGGTRSFRGQQVIVLKNSHGGALYVAARGPHYPVAIVGKRHEGAIMFDDWNAPVTIRTPRHTISLAQLGHLGKD